MMPVFRAEFVFIILVIILPIILVSSWCAASGPHLNAELRKDLYENVINCLLSASRMHHPGVILLM